MTGGATTTTTLKHLFASLDSSSSLNAPDKHTQEKENCSNSNDIIYHAVPPTKSMSRSG
jgi:hypothetical protein